MRARHFKLALVAAVTLAFPLNNRFTSSLHARSDLIAGISVVTVPRESAAASRSSQPLPADFVP
jgi:hypothetical protein